MSEIIGQEIAVKIFSRALLMSRVSHAALLTGIHGTGKTTLARVMAMALCCENGPTPEPCGVCAHCQAIINDSHPDVTEIDAATHTGIDDIREIKEGTRYAPQIARRQIWIVDECHMLSKAASNALLKTLEQPPDEVTFFLCTTEPERLPLTLRSRCQHHALRRVPDDLLIEHYGRICGDEGCACEPEALQMIARAADGSVRDGLSILDAAMASAEADTITAAQVRVMLGLADRSRVDDLLKMTLAGDAAGALAAHAALYADGANPVVLCAELLDGVLGLTRDAVAGDGRPLGKLTRAWQMLLKGCGEVQSAPRPEQALEMLLVRLCYAADMPTPAEVVAALERAAE